ncbi:hypothetical protein ABZZ79_07520 [Streptomyces sp. NPDC006458]|uniref:hypothetical protein n=1 Tax=Streptomyces sp. NPDC006458 TaxID=3154302 RepID=UPI0033B98D03
MSGDGGDAHDEDKRRRTELLWRIGTVVVLVAWIIFLISIADDPGPVCGTGQDKGPC